MRARFTSTQVKRLLSDENISQWLKEGRKGCDIISLTGLPSIYVYKAIREFKDRTMNLHFERREELLRDHIISYADEIAELAKKLKTPEIAEIFECSSSYMRMCISVINKTRVPKITPVYSNNKRGKGRSEQKFIDTRNYTPDDLMCNKCDNFKRCADEKLACVKYSKTITNTARKIPVNDEPTRANYLRAFG